MKAKKFISAVCALAMAATSAATLVSAAGEQVIIKGDQIVSEAGADFTLNFDLASFDGVGFSGCEFAIVFDSSKIKNVKVAGGEVLATGASKEELSKAPTIGEEVTMVNKSETYDCLDYNVTEADGNTVVAVLWCTGLDSSKYWATKTGTLVTLSGTVAEGLEDGTVIPVEIKAIPREGNKDMLFGYADGSKDVTYTSAVSKQGQITIGDGKELVPSWGDVNVDKAVDAKDLVRMMKFMVDPAEANVSDQGLVNGNMDQTDGNVDLKSEDILGQKDFKALKKLILGDYDDSMFPITK